MDLRLRASRESDICPVLSLINSQGIQYLLKISMFAKVKVLLVVSLFLITVQSKSVLVKQEVAKSCELNGINYCSPEAKDL
jgi:hypothetical protein